LENLLFLEVSALLNVKVDDKDFLVWNSEIDPIGVGGGGGGGGGGVGDIVDESNASVDVGDAGADFGRNDTGANFNGGNIGADFNADSVGADFDMGNVGADSDAGRVVDFDADSSVIGGSVGAGSKADLSGIISSIISRGGECTSTMLCCVLSFPFDRKILSMEDVLDLLLLLMVPLYALMSSVK